MREEAVRDGEDGAQAERDENRRARPAMGRFAVLGVEHDVCGT